MHLKSSKDSGSGCFHPFYILVVNAGALPNLTSLQLNNNNIASSIPASFERLTNLTYLDLSDNRLSGAVPASLLSIGTLQRVYFHNNNLSSLPPLSGETVQ